MARNLHADAPMTLARVHAELRWVIPGVAIVFSLLAVGAAADALPWDEPITEAVVDGRTSAWTWFFMHVSSLGSTAVSLMVAAIAALLARRRCPRLAIAIVAIALARPLIEFGIKEFVGRERPVGDRLVSGDGFSFPSGHPLAAAASWGLLPLVVALYTHRRAIWWSVTVAVWVLAVAVAASRVYLAVHWTSDVVGSLLLAILGVLGAEWVVVAIHGPHGPCQGEEDQPADSRLTTSTLT